MPSSWGHTHLQSTLPHACHLPGDTPYLQPSRKLCPSLCQDLGISLQGPWSPKAPTQTGWWTAVGWAGQAGDRWGPLGLGGSGRFQILPQWFLLQLHVACG